MKASYQLTWNDYLAAVRLSVRPSKLAWVWFIIFYGMLTLSLVVAGFQFVSGHPTLIAYMWPLVIIAAVPLLYYFVLIPFNAKQTFQQMKELHGPIEVEVTPTGLRQVTAFSQTLRPWDNFVRSKEDQHTLALYVANNALVFLPKRAFADDAPLEAIRNYLKAAPPRPKPAADVVRRYFIYALLAVAVVVFLVQFLSELR